MNINEEINDEKCVKAIFQYVGTKQKVVISLPSPSVILGNWNEKNHDLFWGGASLND